MKICLPNFHPYPAVVFTLQAPVGAQPKHQLPPNPLFATCPKLLPIQHIPYQSPSILSCSSTHPSPSFDSFHIIFFASQRVASHQLTWNRRPPAHQLQHSSIFAHPRKSKVETRHHFLLSFPSLPFQSSFSFSSSLTILEQAPFPVQDGAFFKLLMRPSIQELCLLFMSPWVLTFDRHFHRHFNSTTTFLLLLR